MKKIFLLLVLLVSAPMFSQTTEVVKERISKIENTVDILKKADAADVEITEAERIIDKYSGKISDTFEKGLETVVPVAEQGFEIATKLQFAKGIVHLSVVGLWVLFLFLTWKTYKVAKEDDPHCWVDGKCGGFALTSLVIASVLTIALPFMLYHGLTHVMAPEWYAIKEIIELFNGTPNPCNN